MNTSKAGPCPERKKEFGDAVFTQTAVKIRVGMRGLQVVSNPLAEKNDRW